MLLLYRESYGVGGGGFIDTVLVTAELDLLEVSLYRNISLLPLEMDSSAIVGRQFYWLQSRNKKKEDIGSVLAIISNSIDEI